MSPLMLKHGVRYGQTVACTKVQYRDTARVQIGQTVPPNHPIITHVSVEVSKENYRVSRLRPSRTPSTDSKKAEFSELLFGVKAQKMVKSLLPATHGRR